MVGRLDRCQAADVIVRTQAPDDRRVVRVSLTPKGEDLLAHLTERNLGSLRTLGSLVEALEAAGKDQVGS
jgi:DNA-binding MarR family transcriptional regulator